MKITVNQLRRIIKEEIESSLAVGDVTQDVKDMIEAKRNQIEAMQGLSDVKWVKFLNSIKDEIEAKHGTVGRDTFYNLAQGDLKDLLSFKYPAGHRSPRDYDEPIGTTVHSRGVDRNGRGFR
jgi:hypothetical protein